MVGVEKRVEIVSQLLGRFQNTYLDLFLICHAKLR